MKTLILAILLCASTAFASPFLVSDPQPLAVGGQFEIQEGGVTILKANNQPDGSIRADLTGVTTGNHAYQVRYVETDPLWGTVYSPFVPFSFTRPVLATGVLSGVKIAP